MFLSQMLLRWFVSFHVSSELITFLLHILVNKVNALAWFTYWGLVTHLQTFMPPLSLPLSLSLSLSPSLTLFCLLLTDYLNTEVWCLILTSVTQVNSAAFWLALWLNLFTCYHHWVGIGCKYILVRCLMNQPSLKHPSSAPTTPIWPSVECWC